MPLSHTTIVRFSARALGHRGEATELHQQRTVAFERDHVPARLRDRHAKGDRNGEAHAAQHVEILRPLAARPQIEIGVADAADHRFVVFELAHQPLGQLETVHHLRVVGRRWLRCVRGHGTSRLEHFPPVSSGERMKVTGACVATACLIERSTMKASSSVARDRNIFDGKRIRAPAAWSCTQVPGRD